VFENSKIGRQAREPVLVQLHVDNMQENIEEILWQLADSIFFEGNSLDVHEVLENMHVSDASSFQIKQISIIFCFEGEQDVALLGLDLQSCNIDIQRITSKESMASSCAHYAPNNVSKAIEFQRALVQTWSFCRQGK
jgi:hypothetical protein